MDYHEAVNDGESTNTVQTTVGELIEAISEIARQAGQTEAEGYRLAAITIEKLMRERRRKQLLP